MWFFAKERKLSVPKRTEVQIRLEAIGGQGANSAGKILAEIAVLGEGFTGNHYSSFGSEKRGTPVKSYVRFSTVRKPIRSASGIRHPNLLVIFHESLIVSHPEIFDGVGNETDVLIQSKKDPHQVELPSGVHPRYLGTIDAETLARKYQSGLNTVMLGAMISFVPELSHETFKKTIENFFVKLSPEERSKNIKGFEAGENRVKVKTPLPDQDRIPARAKMLPRLGYENAPLGGVILNPGNSVLKNHESSRKGFVPRLDHEVCFHCGSCDLVCPDFCFVWKLNPEVGKGAELLGIDYQFCKGCQKCIEVCPVEALTRVAEETLSAEERSVSWVESQKEQKS